MSESNKLVYDLAQDWHSFRRYASTIIDVNNPGWMDQLEAIEDRGSALVKDYNEWCLGRLIIQGLKSAIGDHGKVDLILIPSALKRIMGKIKEWRKKHDRAAVNRIRSRGTGTDRRQFDFQSSQRNRVPIQRTPIHLDARSGFGAAGDQVSCG